jgi:hypothetical protein
MKKVAEKSLAAALLIGFLVGFADYVASVHGVFKYDPPLTEAEYRQIRDLPIEKAEGELKPRTIELSRTRWIFESIVEPWFWWNVIKKSILPIVGIFIACLCVGVLLRRDGVAQ